MTILLIIIAALLVIGIAVMIIIVISKDSLRAALASLVASLVGVIASQHAPERLVEMRLLISASEASVRSPGIS